jgi:hypothetical protein
MENIMTRTTPPVIRDSFNMSADELALRKPSNDTRPLESFSRAASGDLLTDRHLARPSVPERAHGRDFSGKTMARYINGLEARLIDHMRKHAPRWQGKEAARVLDRWHRPAANHPAPSWAVSRDAMADAHDAAAAILRERLVARMGKLGDIRIARTLGGYKQADPLHLLFHNRSPAMPNRLKHKQ